MRAGIFIRDDTLETWKYGQIPPYNYFGSLYFCNLVLLYIVQDQFRTHSTLRMAFRQEKVDDEDTTPMHMTMIGASHGKGIHQRCPSKQGGKG
jgi:hypothetical protein